MPDTPDTATADTPVRPTQRCLSGMALSVPLLTEPLHELDHPLLQKAQRLPAQHLAGGAERVLSLADRLWFKVKLNRHRGAATLLNTAALPPDIRAKLGQPSTWWLGAYGNREAGSKDDFYTDLAAEAQAQASGTEAMVNTEYLLPVAWDWTRLVLEQAEAWRRKMREVVLTLVAKSIRTGEEHVAEFRHHRISALVRAENGNDAYLAIAADGVADHNVIAVILASVPGVPRDDWLPDPDGPGNRHAASGEVVWSTILPHEVTAHILDAVPDDED